MRLRKALTGRRQQATVIAVVVVVSDQLAKLWAVGALTDGPIDVIPGLLRLRLTENSGSAFSLFQNSGQLLGLAAIAAVVLILVSVEQTSRRHELAGMALILGGAVGNLVDRMIRGTTWLDGAVVDFIDLTHWPTFNLADSAISIGAGLFLWAAIRNR